MTTTTTVSTVPSTVPSADRSTDPSTVAGDVLARLERAWNDADGAAFGRVYAPGSSFVTIRGEHIVGSTAIGAGHHGIFTTIYAGSVNRMELVRAEEIVDGVVVAVSLNTLDCPTGPLAGRHQAMSTSVVTRRPDGGWDVTATHNTLLAG
jgi:uncharacterized protein (TIGR02246 family)